LFKVQNLKFKVKSGKFKVKSGKWKVESGKWKVESGKWKNKIYKVVLIIRIRYNSAVFKRLNMKLIVASINAGSQL